MISIEAAKRIIVENTKVLGPQQIEVKNAVGYVLARDVFSPVNLPPFPQSAMDGYAIRHEELAKNNNRLKITAEIPAGSTVQLRLNEGEAMRIFTGAPLPDNADTVVMQEKTSREGDWVIIEDSISCGTNVRTVGEEIGKGQLALEKDTLINAAGVGFLSAIGCVETEVWRKPLIALLITGDELVPPGDPLLHGQVYESNSATLLAALTSTGFFPAGIFKLKDDYPATLHTIEKALKQADVLILSGGISVGDYDFVGKALKELGTEELFYKIRQKPGKPIFYGRNGDRAVFALPGNPASLLTCFYEYTLPALRKMSGQKKWFLKKKQVPMAHDYVKKSDLPVFLRGKLENGKVTVLDGQSSFMLRAFALANCLVCLPEECHAVRKGEAVEVSMLP